MKPEMKPGAIRANWEVYLREFSRRNCGRLTRLGVVKRGGRLDDLWLEDSLPLAGVDLDAEGADAPLVQVMLGRGGASERSMTHTVPHVSSVVIRLTPDGREDGLDIEDGTGTTVVRFEPRSTE